MGAECGTEHHHRAVCADSVSGFWSSSLDASIHDTPVMDHSTQLRTLSCMCEGLWLSLT
jgi:hypothetical protein